MFLSRNVFGKVRSRPPVGSFEINVLDSCETLALSSAHAFRVRDLLLAALNLPVEPTLTTAKIDVSLVCDKGTPSMSRNGTSLTANNIGSELFLLKGSRQEAIPSTNITQPEFSATPKVSAKFVLVVSAIWGFLGFISVNDFFKSFEDLHIILQTFPEYIDNTFNITLEAIFRTHWGLSITICFAN
ncbi:hypothetical protein J6590_056193 [Homalodisca vitripennis]|nr:hypothetical protein J6590_056193 [Homalodisca vitripennis]